MAYTLLLNSCSQFINPAEYDEDGVPGPGNPNSWTQDLASLGSLCDALWSGLTGPMDWRSQPTHQGGRGAWGAVAPSPRGCSWAGSCLTCGTGTGAAAGPYGVIRTIRCSRLTLRTHSGVLTPQTLLSRTNPEPRFSHFRVWWCLAYTEPLVPNQPMTSSREP